jgi:hypothetical protein
MTSLRVSGGTKSSRELAVEARSCREPVLEVLIFSHLSTDPRTKSFAGEVRLARLHGPSGKTTPILGGSVSGNVADVLPQISFSTETGTDFGNPNLGEIPVHVPDLAFLPKVSYAGG